MQMKLVFLQQALELEKSVLEIIIYSTPYMNGRATTRVVFKAYVFLFVLQRFCTGETKKYILSVHPSGFARAYIVHQCTSVDMYVSWGLPRMISFVRPACSAESFVRLKGDHIFSTDQTVYSTFIYHIVNN